MAWLPDDGIIDETAIRRALQGLPVNLTPAERLEVVRRGVIDRDLTLPDVGALFGVSADAVKGWIERAHLTPAQLFGRPDWQPRERNAVRNTVPAALLNPSHLARKRDAV